MPRRSILRPAAAVVLAAAAGLAITAIGCSTTNGSSGAAASPGVISAEQQRAMTPDQVFDELRRGNDRFVRGTPRSRDWMAQAEATASGQYPQAIVLGCVDSRVPVEVVFDQGIGDVFVGRVAGNFENTDLLGSMEFATKVAGSKLIVVLGHTSCGAVKGAIDDVELGNLTPMLANLQPAVDAARQRSGGTGSSSDPAFVDRVVEENVRITVRDIQDRSPVIRELVDQGQLKVVGGIYDLETGRVTWLNM